MKDDRRAMLGALKTLDDIAYAEGLGAGAWEVVLDYINPIEARLTAAERVVEAVKRLYAENDREYAMTEPIPSDEWEAASAEVRAALAAYDTECAK